jgi:hypothetical protein
MHNSRERERTMVAFKRFCRQGNRDRQARPGTSARSPQKRSGLPDLNRGIAVAGTLLFLAGLFIPSIARYPSGAIIPLFAANPFFVSIYIVLALAALVLILRNDLIVTGVIGTTLGLYLVTIGLPAALNGSLDFGFGILAAGDILLVAGCLYPGQ